MDLREKLTTAIFPTNEDMRPIVMELISRIEGCGRDYPIKVPSALQQHLLPMQPLCS